MLVQDIALFPARHGYMPFVEFNPTLDDKPCYVPDNGLTTVLLVAALLSFMGFGLFVLGMILVVLYRTHFVAQRFCAAPLHLLTDSPVTPTLLIACSPRPLAICEGTYDIVVTEETPVGFQLCTENNMTRVFASRLPPKDVSGQTSARIEISAEISARIERHAEKLKKEQLEQKNLRELKLKELCKLLPSIIEETEFDIIEVDITMTHGDVFMTHGFQLFTEDDFGPMFPQSAVESDSEDTSDDFADEIAWFTRTYARQIPLCEFRRQYGELNNKPVDKVPAGPASPPITGVGLRTSTRVSIGVAIQADTTAAKADAPTNHEESNEQRCLVENLVARFGG